MQIRADKPDVKRRIELPVWLAVSLALGVVSADVYAQNSAPRDDVSRYANAELPSWMRIGGEERLRVEESGGTAFKPAGNGYLLQRLRLNLDLTPLPWLKFSFQAQDSRVFFTNVSPAPSSQKDPMDLRLGFVQLDPTFAVGGTHA